jgi:hypothetical protein
LEQSGFHDARGFSIVEVIFATAVMATALVALGQMLALSVSNNQSSHTGTYSTVLAHEKMEQLRALTWGFDALGLPLTDTTTNTALPVESPAGGVGLTPSPPGTLQSSTPGYVDYVDRFGNVLGGGGSVLAKTAYIRRWSIEPLPAGQNNTIVIQVLVTKKANRGAADLAGSTQRHRDEARLMSVKTRKAQ